MIFKIMHSNSHMHKKKGEITVDSYEGDLFQFEINFIYSVFIKIHVILTASEFGFPTLKLARESSKFHHSCAWYSK